MYKNTVVLVVYRPFFLSILLTTGFVHTGFNFYFDESRVQFTLDVKVRPFVDLYSRSNTKQDSIGWLPKLVIKSHLQDPLLHRFSW